MIPVNDFDAKLGLPRFVMSTSTAERVSRRRARRRRGEVIARLRASIKTKSGSSSRSGISTPMPPQQRPSPRLGRDGVLFRQTSQGKRTGLNRSRKELFVSAATALRRCRSDVGCRATALRSRPVTTLQTLNGSVTSPSGLMRVRRAVSAIGVRVPGLSHDPQPPINQRKSSTPPGKRTFFASSLCAPWNFRAAASREQSRILDARNPPTKTGPRFSAIQPQLWEGTCDHNSFCPFRSENGLRRNDVTAAQRRYTAVTEDMIQSFTWVGAAVKNEEG
jgi:hypothetical protein